MLGKHRERKSKASLKFYSHHPFNGLLLQPKECHIGAISARELQNPAVPLLRSISASFSTKMKATIKTMDRGNEQSFIYLKPCDNSPELIFLKSVSLVTSVSGLKCHCYDN